MYISGTFYGRSLLKKSYIILILHFINFSPLVSNSFNIRKMKCCMKNCCINIIHIFFINSCHLLPRKNRWSKKICFIQYDFLKLNSNFYDLALLSRTTSPICSLPPLRTKIVIPLRSSFWEIGKHVEDTMKTLLQLFDQSPVSQLIKFLNQ